jgi:hypothetical protein
LVLGTAGKGPAGIGYQVTQRSTAAKDFGLEESLIHSIEEAATYCDNVVAYRLGTEPGVIRAVSANLPGEEILWCGCAAGWSYCRVRRE